MGASHYSVGELAAMLERAGITHRKGTHLERCEQCLFVLALVRRARGEPSDEQLEVTVDALRSWIERQRLPQSVLVDDNTG